MSCFSPIQGYESAILSKNGKRTFTFSKKYARRSDGKLVTMTTKCRKCVGCRHDYSKEWAIKICHEAQIHDEDSGFPNNSFITLTYNDSKMPLYGSLNYDHFRSFMKRLRFHIFKDYGVKIRFYMIGEYSPINLRPHYHAIIFGFNFPDKYHYLERFNNVIYRSPLLEKCWSDPNDGLSFGYSSVGNVSFSSAAYVARYSMKKLIGTEFDGVEESITEEGEVLVRPRLSERYYRYDFITGERVSIEKERAFMSRMPGIGKEWFDRYALSDFYTKDPDTGIFKDHAHIGSRLVRPPRYYDELLKKIHPSVLEDIKKSRIDFMAKNIEELTFDRLKSKELCLLAALKNKERNIGDAIHVA